MLLSTLIPILLSLPSWAATADEWRSRSVYQLITDRFSPPTPGAPCNPADRVFCGGTYQTVISNLDYIQGMGYDAIWISPTALGIAYDTIYGYNYHGYWTADPTQLNPHFGGSDDLKALSSALHGRGMYLMVDIAINAFASTSNNLDAATLASDDNSTLLFKDEAAYHPACVIDFGNHTSEQDCWLATSGVFLMDLDQSNANVTRTLIDWVPQYVAEYSIDGFRLDASKHMPVDFQHSFCEAAGIFCVGEVAGDNTQYAGTFQGPQGIDSVFGFGMMLGFTDCFTGSPPQPMTTLEYYINLSNTSYSDPTVIGSFLDNQDQPRINSRTNDKWEIYNAIVGTWMYGGIPMIYYGLEQDIADGSADPYNREALWLYNDFSTTGETYGRITNLNKIRKSLGSDFLASVASVLGTPTTTDIALTRAGALIILTNRGSSGTGTWTIDNTGFPANAALIELLTCTTTAAGTDGSVTITWTTGQPFVFVTSEAAANAGLCGATSNSTNATSSASGSPSTTTPSATSSSASSPGSSSASSAAVSADTTSSTSSMSSTASQFTSVVASSSPIATETATVSGSIATSSAAGTMSALAPTTTSQAEILTGPVTTSTYGTDSASQPSVSPSSSSSSTSVPISSSRACKRRRRRSAGEHPAASMFPLQ